MMGSETGRMDSIAREAEPRHKDWLLVLLEAGDWHMDSLVGEGWCMD